MELERIIEILEKHQEWRRDQNVPPKTEMQTPIEIGTAIDYALSELKKLRLGDVSFSLLQRAVEALDDYLNAGSKDTRANAADKAKQIYQEYYGKEYRNRNER